MIVRLQGDRQYQITATTIAQIDALDGQLVAAVQARDEVVVHGLLVQIATLIQTEGTPLSSDHLAASDLVLPALDAHLDDVRELLHEDGLM